MERWVAASGRSRWDRRSALRGAAGALLAPLTLLSACGRAGRARPQATAATVVVAFQFHWANGAPWNSHTTALVQQFLDQTFNRRTRGIRAVPWGICCGKWSQIIAASLGGAGYPDIIGECCVGFASLRDAGILTPLDGYLRRDNVPTSLWSQGHVSVLQAGGRQLGLPMYDGPQVLGYRQDILDQLGLSYPAPDWNLGQAARLWQGCSGSVGGRRRYGASLEWYPGWEYLLRGFGGTEMNPGGTTCLLDAPACVAAVEWFYQLLFAQTITYRTDVAGLADGSAVFSALGGWDIFNEATLLGGRFKWNLVPFPSMAHGHFTYTNKDFWALNRACRHPQEAWTVLRWLAAEPEWQRFIIKTALLEPSLNSLWAEWEAAIRAAAPPLRTIAIGYYKEAAQRGYGIPAPFYTYAPVEARSEIATGLTQIAGHKVSVKVGLRNIARQINALERSSASAAPASFGAQRRAQQARDARLLSMFTSG